ncbi:hypothetical protein LQL77_31510, partial [Rhodococcus cerastii]|nr:hypothetical protein [Rhodococcus cerastii]
RNAQEQDSPTKRLPQQLDENHRETTQFTVARYTDLLHHCARQGDTTAELVEMWLTHHWRAQIADADRLRRDHRNIA